MASVHVLTKTGEGYRLAFHYTVPGGNNGAGFSWATAVINSGLGGTTALKDGDGTAGTISAAEKLAIQNGTVIEEIVTWPPPADGTGAMLLTRLDEHYAARRIEMLAQLQVKLEQFGRNRTVA
jgi:hypothetical protein